MASDVIIKRQEKGRFAKGKAGGPGRPKGKQNKDTLVEKAFCQMLVNDPTYRENFKTAFIARTLGDKLEEMVWHRAYGKPAQSLELSMSFDPIKYLAEKSDD